MRDGRRSGAALFWTIVRNHVAPIRWAIEGLYGRFQSKCLIQFVAILKSCQTILLQYISVSMPHFKLHAAERQAKLEKTLAVIRAHVLVAAASL